MRTRHLAVVSCMASFFFLPGMGSAQGIGPTNPYAANPGLFVGSPVGPFEREIGDSVGKLSQSTFGATIKVDVRDWQGQSVLGTVLVTVHQLSDPTISAPSKLQGHELEFTGLSSGQYVINARAPGYKPLSQIVDVVHSNDSLTLTLSLKPAESSGPVISNVDPSTLPPQAQKLTQAALKDLHSYKIKPAQKQLLKAMRTAPNSYVVNYLLGLTYLWTREFPQARGYLQKGVSLSPHYEPAHRALGTLYSEQKDYLGTVRMLAAAVQSDPNNWHTLSLLGDAYLHEKDYKLAKACAQRAIQYGKAKASAALLTLGQAEAGLGNPDASLAALNLYVKENPNSPNNEAVRQYMVRVTAWKQLQGKNKGPAPLAELNASDAVSGEGSLSRNLPAEVAARPSWIPPDVYAERLQINPGAACYLPSVLDHVGKNVQKLVQSLQSFSAIEQYQAVQIAHGKNIERPIDAKFDYVGLIEKPRADMIVMSEQRKPVVGSSASMGSLVDQGAPALALIFHRDYRSEYAMKCEGLSDWDQLPAWVVDFQQRPDQPTRIWGFDTVQGQNFPLALRGRAWIAAQSYQILHIETDLVTPIKAIRLQREHVSIDYQPVFFHAHSVELWLPANVDIYLNYKGTYIHHYHHFDNYKLFWVGSSEKIGKPKEAAEPNPNQKKKTG